VVGILIFQLPNKSSMLKKGSLMNLVVVPNAVQLRKHKPEIKAAAVTLVNNAKCSRQFALRAEKRLRFLSNLLATNLFIAVSAINLAHAAIGNRFTERTFLSLRA
jgi:hypothetical protein